jgi:Ca2+-dependent lipid-binding protein
VLCFFSGLADPYVVLNISNQQYITKTVNKNLNPKWGESFTLYALANPLVTQNTLFSLSELELAFLTR